MSGQCAQSMGAVRDGRTFFGEFMRDLFRPTHIALVMVLCCWGTAEQGTATEWVVPKGMDNTEGAVSGPGDFQGIGFRVQYLFPASEFAGLPSDQRWITSFLLRPDGQQDAPRTVVYPHITLKMSTTAFTPDTMSPTFDTNVGADVITVYDGPLTLQSTAAGVAQTPHAFEFLFPLAQPFYYDPAKGNLLFDAVAPQGFSPSQFEDNHFGVGQVVTIGAGPYVEGIKQPVGLVAKINFVPEPGAGLLMAGPLVAWMLRSRRRRR